MTFHFPVRSSCLLNVLRNFLYQVDEFHNAENEQVQPLLSPPVHTRACAHARTHTDYFLVCDYIGRFCGLTLVIVKLLCWLQFDGMSLIIMAYQVKVG